MTELVNVLWEWRFVMVLTAAFLVYFLFERERGKSVLYALMLQAKRLATDAILRSGQEQEDWVVKKALLFLPLPVRLFFGEDGVRRLVKVLFHKAKDYLDNGKLDNSL